MRDLSLPVRMVLGAYALTRKAGVLETRWGRALFRQAYFRYKRWFEDPYASLLARYPQLIRDGHVLDVGANIGYTACLFGRRVSGPYRVFAFEPEADNVRLLSESVRAAGLQEQIEIVASAVGERSGVLTLHRNLNHHADHRVLTAELARELDESTAVQVPQVSLDAYWRMYLEDQPISFLKLDVQGYEPCVIDGMRELLAGQRRMCIGMEYAPADMTSMGLDADAMWAALRDAGFRPHAINRKQGLQPMGWDELTAQVAIGKYGELLMAGPDADAFS